MFSIFLRWKMRYFLNQKVDRKMIIYWLLKRPCFELLGDGKYGLSWVKKLMEKMIFTDYGKVLLFELFGGERYRLFLSQEIDGKMVFTGYGEAFVLNFLVMGNTIFFLAKKLMERWFLLCLFELSMIFQDLGNTVFRAESNKY